MKKSINDLRLSSGTWNLFALLGLGSTLFYAYAMISIPACDTPIHRFVFAACGVSTLAAMRRLNWIREGIRRGIVGNVAICIVIAVMLGAVLFPLFAKAKSRSGPNSMSRLKMITLALSMYENDYDAYPSGNPYRIESALSPYLPHSVYRSGRGGNSFRKTSFFIWQVQPDSDSLRFVINRAVAGKPAGAFPEKSGTVFAYAPTTVPIKGDGTPYRLAAVDTKVSYIEESRFQQLRAQTAQRADKWERRTAILRKQTP